MSKLHMCLKNRFHSNCTIVLFSTTFRPKIKKIVRAVFEKNIKVSDFGLIWGPFREYVQIKICFQKSDSAAFLPL